MNNRIISIVLGVLLAVAIVIAGVYVWKNSTLRQTIQAKEQQIADHETQQLDLQKK